MKTSLSLSLSRKKRNRRYYLHRRIRAIDPRMHIDAHSKTIYCPYTWNDHEGVHSYLVELRTNYGYALQLEIE